MGLLVDAGALAQGSVLPLPPIFPSQLADLISYELILQFGFHTHKKGGGGSFPSFSKARFQHLFLGDGREKREGGMKTIAHSDFFF